MSTPGPGDALPHLARALEDVAAQLTSISGELRVLALADTDRPVQAAPPASQESPRRETPPTPAAQPYPPMGPPVQPPQAPAYGPPPGQAYPSPYLPYPQYRGPVPPPSYGPSPGYGAAPPPRPPKPPLSERLSAEGAGSKMLAWIGGGITLIGVVLLLVLAIQRGWIGPVPRVVVGAVLAGSLIAIALRVHRSPNAWTGAFALAATGFAALYLDVVAATTLLELIPAWLGLLIGLLIAGAGLMLSGRWDAQPLAIFVLLACAVCAPMITVRFDYLLVAFLLVLQVATTPLQLARDWRAVPLAAGLPPLIATMIAAPYTALSGDSAVQAAALAVVASLLSIGAAAVTAHRRPEDPAPVLLLVSAPLPTLLAALMIPSHLGAAATAAVAVPLVLLWGMPRFGATAVPARFAATAGALGALNVFEATALLLPADAIAIGLLGEAIVLAVASIGLKGRGLLISGTVFATVGTVLAMATSADPDLVLLPPRSPMATTELLLSGLAFALIAAATIAQAIAAQRLNPGHSGAVALWLIAGAVTLYGTTGTTLTLALLPLPDRTGFLLGHAVVTISWTVAALVLLLSGITRRIPRLCGLILVGSALLKLVLFDLASLDGIARAATFLGAGLVLLAAGTWYARRVNAEQERRREPEDVPSHDTERQSEPTNP